MQIKDYSGMLKIIAIGSSVILFSCLVFLKYQTNLLDEIIEDFPSISVELVGVELSSTYILPSLIWIFISISLKVHDRLSNLFKIRHRFDYNHVLLKFVEKLNIPLNDVKKSNLSKNRKDLMYKIFYKYADSSKPESDDNISPHLIHKALNNWTYFWVLLEGQIFIIATIIVFTFEKNLANVIITFIILIVTIIIQFLIYKEAKQIANQEINEILLLNNGEKKERIKKDIKHALQN